MKYLQNRNQFINRKIVLESSQMNNQIQNSRLIRETFENDITWGGSLLGRLINSIIRRVGIYAGTARIPFLVSAVRSELDKLLFDVTTTPKQKEEFETINLTFLLEEIYKIVEDEKLSTNQKCTKLLGKKGSEDGILNQVLKDIEKISGDNFPKKDELLTKLENFKRELEKIDWDPENDKEEIEEVVEESSDAEIGFIKQSELFLYSISQLGKAVEKYKPIEEDKTGSKSFGGKEQADVVDKATESLQFEYLREYYQNESLPIFEGLTIKELVEGKVYNSNGKKVKVLSTTHEMKKQGQGLVKVKPLPADGTMVCVEVEGGGGINTVQVSSLEPIDQAQAQKGQEEGQKKNENAILNRIVKKFQDKKSILDEIIKAETEVREIETKEKLSFFIKLAQGIGNTKSIGYAELIKEALANEDDIIKKVQDVYSLVLPFFEKEGKELFEALKEDAENDNTLGLKNFTSCLRNINSSVFGKDEEKGIKDLLPEIIEEQKEKTDKESQKGQSQEESEESQKGQSQEESRRIIFDFKKFRMFEEISYSSGNPIEDAWQKFFEEGEEKEWKVEEKRAKDLMEETKNIGEKPFAIEEDSCRDHIIRIVNLFGRAYRNYATMNIPSGRPEGRISLATYREYQFIGDDDDKAPEWDAEANPGRGPWAAILPYRQWQDGIMKILEDTKYRKILANARFLPKGVGELGSGDTESDNRGAAEDQIPEKVIRAGRSLFDFMNDLISGVGEFDKVKRKILKEYFRGADKIDAETKSKTSTATVTDNKSSRYKKDTLIFTTWNDTYGLARTDGDNPSISKFDHETGDYMNETIKITFKKNVKLGDKEPTVDCIIGFVSGVFKVGNSYALTIKFNFGTNSDRSSQTSFISSYFSEDIQKGTYKLDDTVKPKKGLYFYLGVIVFKKRDSKFKVGGDTKYNLKYAQITKNNDIGKVEVLEFDPDSILGLVVNDGEEYKVVKLEEGKPSKFNDPDIKEIRTIKNLLQKFGI